MARRSNEPETTWARPRGPSRPTPNERDVSTAVMCRELQEDAAKRIQERDFELHTGGCAFILRMEEIMRPKPLEV